MAEILIDGYNLGMTKGTGIATYARNLSKAVTQIGHEVSVLYGQSFADKDDPLLREISFFDPIDKKPKKVRKALDVAGKALRSPFVQYPQELKLTGAVVSDSFASRLPECAHIYNGEDLFHRSSVGFTIGRGFSRIQLPNTVDLAHWTYPLPTTVKDAANIYTLHDLVPLKLPYTTLDNKRYYLKLMKEIVQRADHIVTVSESSRRDIIEMLGVPEDRITNTYQSVQLPKSALRYDETEVARILERGVGVAYKSYYLFWGSIEPKKNIHRLVEAYLASGVEAPLVIVGAQAWKSEDELRLVREQNAAGKNSIIQLSYAPQDLLIHLIRGAKAALFPSLYEGFGLPALEAMILGTPVICSNTASLPEVVGDAALTTDPYNSHDIAKAFREMDGDSDLRAELSKRGIDQAEKFSPEQYRRRLSELYERLL
ncbi:MAG: glycosyltransferase family 1 protein [Pseudomonadota bacterium]